MIWGENVAPALWLKSQWMPLIPEGTKIAGHKAFNDEVARRYKGPGRFYHNLYHIWRVVRGVLGQVPDHPEPALVFAAFLHDVIYDTHAKDNEERSAEFASELLAGLGVPKHDRDETARLILLTTTHLTSPDDLLGSALLDADLEVLCRDEKLYDAYAEAIRKEYARVPEADYRAGRRGVLESFLSRPVLYLTPLFRPYEPLARANLAREIASLS
jgi:predicted metal-dependent HD superfamily phosphohydrolase